MISKERYKNLVKWFKCGANLAPIDFQNMIEYEKIMGEKQKDKIILHLLLVSD